MAKNHFFLDTNFLADYPNFYDEYAFNVEPYYVVVCKVVLNELDNLKKAIRDNDFASKDQNTRAFNARSALRSLEVIQTGESFLPFGGELIIYDKQIRAFSKPDEQIINLAKKYAQEQANGEPVILLTSDVNFRIQARNEIFTVEDPAKWLEKKMQAAGPAIEYERMVRQISRSDSQLKLAYETRTQCERNLADLIQNGGDAAQVKKLKARLKDAQNSERSESERYQHELEQHQRELEQQKEQRQLEIAKNREARRNKNNVELKEIILKRGELSLPIEKTDFSETGKIKISRQWWYQQDGFICTAHIDVNLGGQETGLLVISAMDTLPYKPIGRYQLISPSNFQKPKALLVETWKIDVEITKWKVNPRPILNNYTKQIGPYAIFEELAFSITATELSAEEAEELKQKSAKEERRIQTRKRREYWLWMILAGLLVTPVACVIAAGFLIQIWEAYLRVSNGG